MTTACRFSTCSWFGSCDDLFTHCEEYHRPCIKYLVQNNRYDFTFADLSHEAYLLCGKAGLYWFCLDTKTDAQPEPEPEPEADGGIRRGVFAIGESEPIEYTVKLGLIRDGHADYWGPYKSRPERNHHKPQRAFSKSVKSKKTTEEEEEEEGEQGEVEDEEIYDLRFTYAYLEFMNDEMPSRTVRLYVGAYDDSDDQYLASYEELDWSDAEEQAVNQLCVQKFTCCICFEYIRRNARFCERRHFVCGNCFDEMVRRRQLRCPLGRCDYLYDCHDDRVEELLRLIKFPAEEEQAQGAGERDYQGASSSKHVKSK